MIFGAHVRWPDTGAPAGWIAAACRGASGTVGALVPNHYPAVLRVGPPSPQPDGWWTAYRQLYETVAWVGGRHTLSRDRAWFAVWEGHGFDTATTHVAWRHRPPDASTGRARDQERWRQRREDERRNGDIRSALLQVPRFDLPNRTYYLLEGPVSAIGQLCHPEPPGEWRNPDLFWPDDRRWFVATDVDFWSLYVGGDSDLLAELAEIVPTRTEVVALDHRLEIED